MFCLKENIEEELKNVVSFPGISNLPSYLKSQTMSVRLSGFFIDMWPVYFEK